MTGIRDNCRNGKKCIFCRYWLGSEPEVDYLTGDCKYTIEEAVCALGDNIHSTSDSVCQRFSKALRYM